MGVTDIQYCLILLHALPTSYEVLASTILASGTPATLKHAEITARILNEEGHCSGCHVSDFLTPLLTAYHWDCHHSFLSNPLPCALLDCIM